MRRRYFIGLHSSRLKQTKVLRRSVEVTMRCGHPFANGVPKEAVIHQRGKFDFSSITPRGIRRSARGTFRTRPMRGPAPDGIGNRSLAKVSFCCGWTAPRLRLAYANLPSCVLGCCGWTAPRLRLAWIAGLGAPSIRCGWTAPRLRLAFGPSVTAKSKRCGWTAPRLRLACAAVMLVDRAGCGWTAPRLRLASAALLGSALVCCGWTAPRLRLASAA